MITPHKASWKAICDLDSEWYLGFFTANAMKGFKVVVGDKKPKDGKDLLGKDYKVCGQHKRRIRNGRRVSVRCKKQPSGRFVFVFLPRQGVLKICKARIYKRTEPPGKPEPEEPGKPGEPGPGEPGKPEEPEEPEGIWSVPGLPLTKLKPCLIKPGSNPDS